MVRAQLARDNEALVRAESALRSERTVSWGRMAVIGLVSVGMLLVRLELGLQARPDVFRGLALLLYTGFCATHWWIVPRARPELGG